ncbi:MAG TPA: AraC family transcriptional regulator [Terracidiphilus sp.]|jgi:AraC-like DNA-binding protein|nr:AraC family transcriptional regulator [Terracidiphilus sp.]
MLADLKLARQYDGLLYLAESARNVPKLDSHHHVELELNLVVRGWVTYVVGGRRYTFPSRTLLWLFPEQEHQLVARSDDAQYYVAVFKPSLIAKSCRTPAYEGLKRGNHDRNGVLNTHLTPDTFDLIRKTMDSLMEGALDPDVLNREAGYGWLSNFSFEHGDPDGLNAGLHHLLLLCWRSQKTGKGRGNAMALHRAVRRALELMSDGGAEMNLGQLARACGTSDAYLSRTFRRQIGVPLSHYRNSLRLSRFWEEFRGPEQKTVAEAVYAAGFGSYAQFYKVFTQAYGQGPRACLATGATSAA